jgi:predicted PurR-regulated permease PerM
MEKPRDLSKYFFWIIVVALLVLSYFIIKPFIIALLSAFILAFLIKPIHTKLSKQFNSSLSALISVIIALAIIIIPLLLIIQKLLKQISTSLSVSAIELYITNFSKLPILDSIPINSESLANQISSAIFSVTKTALTHIPGMALTIIITIIGIYYILKNWDFLSEKLESYIPFKEKKTISKELGETTKNIIFGYLLIAIIEFIVASLGFYISGVTNFLLLALIVAILAFIPSFGPLIIWAPLLIFHLILGNYGTSIGILITGLILSIGIDNILAPKFVGSRSKIHPLIMLIGILGGLSLFGLFGFVVGPLILVYTLKLLEEATMRN